MPLNPFQLASGIFGSAEQAKHAAVGSAIADIDLALPDMQREWKSRAYDALEGTPEAKAAALEAKAKYDALLERREFAVAAAAELDAQITAREDRKRNKARKADRRALAAHLGNVRTTFARCIALQSELQLEFDGLMSHAVKAFALIPRHVKGELGSTLQIENFRSLLAASAQKIAQDIASPSPLPDPNVMTRLPEFTDWKTGATRAISDHVAEQIAGLKARSFPEFEPVAAVRTAAVAVKETAVSEPVTASAAAVSNPYGGEVIDMRKIVMIGEEAADDDAELVDMPLPELPPIVKRSQDELEALAANASV